MNEIPSTKGNRSDIIAVDGEAVLAELSRGKFFTSTNSGTYVPEMMTTSYTQSLFDSLQSVENYWSECVRYARGFIENFQNIPMPTSFQDDSSFLDETEYENPVSASLQGVTSNLNIRSSASSKSDKVGSIPANGQIDSVIGEVTGNDGKKWYKIKTADGKEGYVSADYVRLNNEATPISNGKPENASIPSSSGNQAATGSNQGNTTTPTSNSDTTPIETETVKGVVKLGDATSYLNVRSSASKGNNIIGKVNDGTELKIIEGSTDDAWLKIEMPDGTTGYVSSDYINISNK